MPQLCTFRHERFNARRGSGGDASISTNASDSKVNDEDERLANESVMNEDDEDDEDDEDETSFEFTLTEEQGRCYIRVTLASVSVPVRAYVDIYVHPITATGSNTSYVHSIPLETLRLDVEWTDGTKMQRPTVRWKRIMRTTSFNRTQLETLYERFWTDTCVEGTPGQLRRPGFDRIMSILLRDGTPGTYGTAIYGEKMEKINKNVLDSLWYDFDRDGRECLKFDDLGTLVLFCCCCCCCRCCCCCCCCCCCLLAAAAVKQFQVVNCLLPFLFFSNFFFFFLFLFFLFSNANSIWTQSCMERC